MKMEQLLTQVLEYIPKATTTSVSGSSNAWKQVKHPIPFTVGLSVSLSYTQNGLTFSLNCSSTGLPPTNVTWSKDGIEMSSGGNYMFSQRVIDVNNTVYENIIVINGGTGNNISGLYQCCVQCYDDLGIMKASAVDFTIITGKFAPVIVCKVT